ncbi:MAG: c-type cytochrome [Vicinamibacterales bacterium]
MRVLRWTLLVAVILALGGLLAFLYLIPPFNATPPEEYIRREATAAPQVNQIKDPAARLIAERGRYLVMTTGCVGCHITPGPRGPAYDMYLAGGMKMVHGQAGTSITPNLTPDAETGLGKWTDEEIKLVLRSGISPDGRQVFHRLMPWATFSRWSEEDRHAAVVYLRTLKAIRHRIPDPSREATVEDEGAAEAFYLYNYGVK